MSLTDLVTVQSKEDQEALTVASAIKRENWFHAKWSNSQFLKKIFEAIKVVDDEDVTFTVEPKGLSLQMLDPSRVMMIDLQLPNYGCEEYVASNKFEFTVCLRDFLKNVYKKETVTLDVTLGDLINECKIKLKSKFERNFKFELRDNPATSLPKLPTLNFGFKAKIVLEDLVNLVKDAGGTLTLIGKPDSLKLESHGSNWNAVLNKENESVFNISSIESSRATFAIKYVRTQLKALNKLSGVVDLQFSSEKLLKLQCDLMEFGGSITYLLAPRIEEA